MRAGLVSHGERRQGSAVEAQRNGVLETFGFVPSGNGDQSDFDVVCIVAILDRRSISETVGLLAIGPPDFYIPQVVRYLAEFFPFVF